MKLKIIKMLSSILICSSFCLISTNSNASTFSIKDEKVCLKNNLNTKQNASIRTDSGYRCINTSVDTTDSDDYTSDLMSWEYRIPLYGASTSVNKYSYTNTTPVTTTQFDCSSLFTNSNFVVKDYLLYDNVENIVNADLYGNILMYRLILNGQVEYSGVLENDDTITQVMEDMKNSLYIPCQFVFWSVTTDSEGLKNYSIYFVGSSNCRDNTSQNTLRYSFSLSDFNSQYYSMVTTNMEVHISLLLNAKYWTSISGNMDTYLPNIYCLPINSDFTNENASSILNSFNADEEELLAWKSLYLSQLKLYSDTIKRYIEVWTIMRKNEYITLDTYNSYIEEMESKNNVVQRTLEISASSNSYKYYQILYSDYIVPIQDKYISSCNYLTNVYFLSINNETEVATLKDTITKLNNEIDNYKSTIEQLKTQIENSSNYTFNDLIYSVVTIPSTFLSQWFSVEILGVNLWSVLLSLVSGVLIIYLIKKLI